MGSAMWAVIGILAALRERDRTGKGGIVDTSLYETSLAWMSIMLAGYLANGELPARHGSGVRHDRAVSGLRRPPTAT